MLPFRRKMPLEPTIDPDIFIEERRQAYIRYRNVVTNDRWEVRGECIKLGHCMVGAVVDNGNILETFEEARQYITKNPLLLDSPVVPGFSGCCPLTIVELK